MTLATVALVGANLFVWNFLQPGAPPESPEVLTAKITALEQEIPPLEETAQWVERVEDSLKNPPSGSPQEVLQEISALAGARGVTLQKSSTWGGEPPRIQFSGIGPYAGIADLANALETRSCVQIAKMTLEKRDDGSIEAGFEALVRSGQWEGQGQDRPRPELLPAQSDGPTLDGTDIFNRIPQQEAPPPVTRPNIRYLGLYAGKRQTSVILEVAGASLLVRAGEPFSQDLKVVAADRDTVRITDGRGEEWSVPMEQPR